MIETNHCRLTNELDLLLKMHLIHFTYHYRHSLFVGNEIPVENDLGLVACQGHTFNKKEQLQSCWLTKSKLSEFVCSYYVYVFLHFVGTSFIVD